MPDHNQPRAGTLGLDHLEQDRLAKGQRRLLMLSVGGVFLDGYDITIISLGLLQLKGQFHMNSFETGFVASAILLGNFVGALFFGRLADRVGRRAMFLLDVVFFIVFAVISAFSKNYLELSVFRFLLGVGIGGDYALASPIIAEAVPSKRRGRVLTINWGLAWLSGEIVSFAAGLFLLSTTGNDAWRWMLASGAIPAVAVLLARRSMQESPRWLMDQGRGEDASHAIGALTGISHVQAISTATLQTGVVTPENPTFQGSSGSAASLGSSTAGNGLSQPNLCSSDGDGGSKRPKRDGPSVASELWGRYRRNTWFGMLNYIFEGAPFYAVSVFLPTILKSAGYSKTNTGIAIGNLFLQMFGLIGILLIFILVDRKGRKFVNYLGYGGITVALVVYVILYPPKTTMLVLIFAVVEIAVWLGPASTDNLYLGELWPTRIRATGAGVCAGAGRLSAIAGTLSLPLLISAYGANAAMIPLIILSVLGIANTAILGVETKGKTLEELWGDNTTTNPTARSEEGTASAII